MSKEKIKEIWKKEKDLVCGVMTDGRYFVSDNYGGLVLPGKDAGDRERILGRFEARKRERKFSE